VIIGNDDAIRFYERIGFRVQNEGPDAESGAAYGALAMERPVPD
jgi:ribosomal protein S18 acetylase RimI-like enzyme